MPVPDLAPAWEIAKGVMLSLTTLGVAGMVRMQLRQHDELREIKHELFGRDGTNGMKSDVRSNRERLDAIEERNLSLDAVAKVEKAQYQGDERRHDARRLRDMIRDEIDHLKERES